jgi:hypothetical protein
MLKFFTYNSNNTLADNQSVAATGNLPAKAATLALAAGDVGGGHQGDHGPARDGHLEPLRGELCSG